MKKTSYLIPIAVICFMACGGKQQPVENQETKSENVITESEATEEEFIDDESSEVTDILYTPDLAMFNLQGPVKKVTSTADKDFTVCYDELGRLTYISYVYGSTKNAISYESTENGRVTGREGHNVKRDNNGRITSITAGSSDCDEDDPGVYVKYQNGHVSQFKYSRGDCAGYVFVETTAVDEHNRVTQEMTEYYGPGINEETTTTYTYTKVDQWGNWTQRSFKKHTVYEEYEYDDETGNEKTVLEEEHGDSGVETRTIVYY